MARSEIRGGQIKDDSITGDDVSEISLRYPVTVIYSGNDPGTTYTVSDSDRIILINTRTSGQNGIDSAIDVTMPSSSGNAGRIVVIKDAGGYCETNAIRVLAPNSNNFEGNPGLTSLSLDVNGSSRRFVADGSSSWYEI
tara:strand:- start:390 stop:806 length:417 start_codon:yes stop_codon:yes gene_type:complete